MKKLFFLFVSFLATTCLWAYDFQSGDLYYYITSDIEPYTVKVDGPVSLSITTATIPETVTYNGTTYSVTSIGSLAFYGCSSLTSITIPNSVTSIGDNAFYYCESLTSITIPNSVTSIGNRAFAYCSSLTSLTIPEGVTSIREEAFYGCSSLTSITIPNSVTSIGKWAFYNTGIYNDESNWENGVLYISSCLIEANEDIAGVYTIKDGTRLIAGYAFYDCSSLTSVCIPNSVTSIGDYTFQYCSSLTSITIPNSVTSIGWGAFQYCSSLTSVTIPNSVTSIGGSAFSSCSSLTSITIPNSVTSIGSGAFYNCSSLTSITIPNSVTSIGNRAFAYCSSLTSLTIPEGVTSIGEEAFYGCSSLKSITIPNSVTSIGGSAFEDCSALESVTIPEGVTSIGDGAFEECSSLSVIICKAETPASLGSSVFDGVSKSIPVYVPCGCVKAYKAANGWEDFTNIQEPQAEYSIQVYPSNDPMGSAKVDYNTFCEGAKISAEPNYGYHFAQWNDGNTDNPRTLKLTQDTIFTAEFAQTFSGQCGDNLYWNYDENSQLISITGSGEMYDYTADTQPWLLFKEQILEVTTSNTTTSIGAYAFDSCIRLGKVYLGPAVENIAENAFAGCNRLYHVYCYPSYPPFAKQSSFDNYNVYLHVPCDSKEGYDLDIVWGNFKYIQCIGSEEVEGTDDVVIDAGSTTVTITWPTEEDADSYTIVIMKDGEVVCTLTFNSDGQLLNIAFMPGSEGNNRNTQFAEAVSHGTGTGFRFTVTGLEEGTDYDYTITAKDEADNTVATHTGEFKTNALTAVDNIGADAAKSIEKLLRNGQLIIIRDGKAYNVVGQIVE